VRLLLIIEGHLYRSGVTCVAAVYLSPIE